MLPPDNFQEDPLPVLAHRTSPTNLGLYLLTVVAARDFGWIGMPETVERLEATLESMEQLERHRGHFYNWYWHRSIFIHWSRDIFRRSTAGTSRATWLHCGMPVLK